jgi:hypothetical protein
MQKKLIRWCGHCKVSFEFGTKETWKIKMIKPFKNKKKNVEYEASFKQCG